MKYIVGSSERTSDKHKGLPLVVVNFLEHGAPEGQRNATLCQVAVQIRDIGLDENQAINILSGKAVEIGLHPAEISKTIHSAFTRPRREPPAKPGTSVSSSAAGTYASLRELASKSLSGKTPDSVVPKASYILSEDALPAQICPDGGGAREFLKALFRTGERIQIIRAHIGEDGKEEPSYKSTLQVTRTLEEWLDRLDKTDGDVSAALFPSSEPHGVYVCINPLMASERKYDGIAAFRFALIEFDHIPHNHQWQLIQQSKIPCAAVTDSGGKSIHAIVRVDARNVEEYKQRVKMLIEHFTDYGVDPQNIDPTRLSRLPGPMREDTRRHQRLIHGEMGFKTFAEWEQHAVHDHALPPQITVEELEGFDPAADPDSMFGKRWLCRGDSMMMIGQSGIGKSSLLMQKAISWALGKDFFGITPKQPMRSLIIQAENNMGDLAEAYQGITNGMRLTEAERAVLRKNLIFHRDTVHTGEVFVAMAARMIEKHRPDIVFADPMLSFIGGDISKQEVAGGFLRNQLGPVMLQSKVIWVWLHHTGKPPGDKSSRDGWSEKDLAYSGMGSSELTNSCREICVLQKIHADLDIYSYTLCKRGPRSGMKDEADNETITIHLQHAKGRICWERADLGDVDAVKEEKEAVKEAKEGKAGRGRPKSGMHGAQKGKLLRWLMDNDGCSMGKLVIATTTIMKCSTSTARKALNALVGEGAVSVSSEGKEGGSSSKKCHAVKSHEGAEEAQLPANELPDDPGDEDLDDDKVGDAWAA